MPRSFIAIEASEEVRDSLANVQNELKQTGGDLKIVKPENIHLTLKFLGDVSESRIGLIKDALHELETPDSFQIQVEGMGVFPKPSFIRVVWAGVSKGSEKVKTLQSKLDQKFAELDFSPENKEFTPHFTIARVKSGKAKDKIRALVKEKSNKRWGTIDVWDIELKKSELTSKGPIYTTLESVSLS